MDIIYTPGGSAFYSFLGLAARAGAVMYGADAVDGGIKNGKVKLAIVDGGASENTKKDFSDACAHYGVKLMIMEEQGTLGDCLGKPGRKVIGIKDAGFAKNAIKKVALGSGGEKLEQNKDT